MKYLVALCWVITIPMAIFKLSYDSAYAYVEFKVGESFK
jgi:hypothetical protein